MSLSQAETRLLQQLRDDVDRLIANGRGDSRTAQTRGDGTTVLKAYKAANGFIVGNGVYLDYADNTWKKINGTSFAYEDYLWGIVSFKIDVNKFSVVVNGEVRIPGATYTVGAPYGFNASGVLDATAARPVVKATLADSILVGASVGGSDAAITADINHTAHGFTVGTFLYRDDTTGLYARTDNTDPSKCDVRGWVSTVVDANNFTLTMEGWRTGIGASTATLYLSTSGAVTAIKPTYGAVIPVLYPVDRSGSFDAYFSSLHNRLADNEFIVTQTGHGFAAGNVLKGGGTSWSKAKADTIGNARVTGIVTRVISVDTFVVASSGVVSVSGAGYSTGTLYYLSGTADGAVETGNIVPATGYAVPVYVAVSSTRIALCFGEPTYRMQIGDSSQPGMLRISSTFGPAIELDSSMVSSLAKKLYVREWILCEGATTKKCLILSSDLYT